MWNPPQLPNHDKCVENSSLNGLMNDVESYLTELNKQQQQQPALTTPPTRAQSLQHPSRQPSPHNMSYRSQTTYRPYYVKYYFSLFLSLSFSLSLSVCLLL
jgi:hypothetical protein